jgi:hypothetical protein
VSGGAREKRGGGEGHEEAGTVAAGENGLGKANKAMHRG